jgi:hypothetical protein
MRKALIITIVSILIVGICMYSLTPKVIKMYACAESAGTYSWKENECLFPDEFVINCFAFIFDNDQQRADSLKAYYIKLQEKESADKRLWEQLYFCTFPSTFEQMVNIFGYTDLAKTTKLYYNGLEYINAFKKLESIPKIQLYKKHIDININGYYLADNIQGGFGIDSQLLNDSKTICNVLDEYTETEIKSVFKFIFDSLHPKNQHNEDLYKKLKIEIDSKNKKLSHLLTESYKEIISKDSGH